MEGILPPPAEAETEEEMFTMVKDGSSYCIVFCKVLKRDVARFEEALERLKDKMLLLGHKDYPDACGKIAKMIEEGTKARMRK